MCSGDLVEGEEQRAEPDSGTTMMQAHPQHTSDHSEIIRLGSGPSLLCVPGAPSALVTRRGTRTSSWSGRLSSRVFTGPGHCRTELASCTQILGAQHAHAQVCGSARRDQGGHAAREGCGTLRTSLSLPMAPALHVWTRRCQRGSLQYTDACEP